MNTGITKRGFVSETSNQRKMHVSAMTDEEVELIYSYMQVSLEINKPKLARHLERKISSGEIKLSKEQLADTLGDAHNLVEFNTDGYSVRGLYRSKEPYWVTLDDRFVIANLCVVVDLDTLTVITAYYNSVNDGHSTINMNRYTEIDIKEVLYGQR